MRRKIVKILAYGSAGLAVLVGVTVLAAVLFVQGERLAAIVNGVLPPMKGSIHFGAIGWKPKLLVDLVTDRPTPMSIDGLRIVDPEGTTVLDVPHLDVAVRLRTLIGGAGIILHDLHVGPDSVWRFSKMLKRDGIGFLAAIEPKQVAPPAPPRPAGAPKEKGFVFQIASANLDGFRAIFDFPGSWGLDLRDIHSPASLLIDSDGFVGWDVVGLEARKGGYLMVMDQVLPFDQVFVDRVATTREWPDDIFLDLRRAQTGRSELLGKGFFTGIYGAHSVGGIKIHAEFAHAVDALTAVAKPHGIAGLKLSGDDAKVVGDLWDPYESLKIKAAISDLDAAYESYEAKSIALRAGIVFATTAPTMTITVDELSLGSPAGGRFQLAATMAGDDVTAKLDLDHFSTAPYVPKALAKLAAGKAHGHVSIAGNIGAKKSARVSGLDLRYDRAFPQTGIPRSVRITGAAEASAERIATSGLHVEIPGAKVDLRGQFAPAKKLIDAGLRIGVYNLPELLSTVKIGPLAKNAAVAVDVKGTTDRPSADGSVEVNGIGGGSSGIPAVGQFRAGFHLRGGSLAIDGLHADLANGSIDGGGSAQIFNQTTQHMLSAPILDFRLDGRHIELADLVSSGIVSGRLSFGLSASGTSKNPKVHVNVPAGTTVTVLGQSWTIEGLDIEAGKDALVIRVCHIAGAAGGDIQIEGRVDLAQRPLGIDWRIRIQGLPLATVLAAAGVDIPAFGNLGLDLRIGGNVGQPSIEGTLALTGVRAAGTELGDANLVFSPAGAGGIAVTGMLFGKLKLDATAALEPKGPRAVAVLSFDDLHVEDYLPELKEQRIATTVSARIGLDLQPGHLPVVDVLVKRLEAEISRDLDQDDGTTTTEQAWLRNSGDLHIVTDTERLVVDPAKLVTRGGDFTLAGRLAPVKNGAGKVVDQSITAEVLGKLDLDLLQPLLASKLEVLRGGIALELHAGGSVKKPEVSGGIGIARPVVAKPRGMDRMILVPSGSVKLNSSSVALAGLAVTVDNATMRLDGQVNLGPNFTPTTVAVHAAGDVSASLLESLAPSAVTDVSGKAQIALDVRGRLDDPQVAARITLGEIEMRLRDVSRRITVQSGQLDLTNQELLLRDVRVLFDDDGQLLIGAGAAGPGRVRIRRLRPTFEWESITLPLQGTRLAYRDGGLEIDDLSMAMALSGTPRDGLSLAGDVRLVSGRYTQDFNVSSLVLSQRINESSRRPFWYQQPLLRDLALALRVRTEGDGFVVQNNLAPEIHVLVDLGIGGTLSQPALSGEIRPTDGRFHIIGLRGDFELSPNVNHVTFVPTKSIAAGDTPELNLEATNIFPDSSGVEHTVLMRISGPINQATIDLSTTDGMDRNQTMLLLLSGRTTDPLSGGGGQVFGMNQQSGLDMLGQLSRDTVSSLVEPYIDDTLQRLTGGMLNVRPTVGADGLELRVNALATREIYLEGSYLRGFQNQLRYRAQALLWLYDYITLRGSGEQLTYTIQQGLPVQTRNLQLELTFEYPLRFPNP